MVRFFAVAFNIGGANGRRKNGKPFCRTCNKHLPLSFRKILSQGNDTAQKPSEQVPVQKDVKEPHPRVTNIVLAGAFLVLFAVVVAALGWVMIRFGITLPIIVAIFIILAIFAVIVFPFTGTGQRF